MQNRDALFLPEIDDLFKRALEDHPEYDYIDVWSWVGAFLIDPDLGVFLARIGDKWCGLAIVSAKSDVWNPDPVVLFLFAGGRGVFAALMDEVKVFCDPKSSRFRFVNGTRHSDAGYARLLRPWAAGTKVGALIDCTWREDGA